MPKLFVLTGADVGAIHEITGDATLGRGADCTVRLRDTSISRNHARIERADGGWRIVDTGSRNGVRVGEHKVEAAPLEDGTVFACGELELRFRMDEALLAAASEQRASPPPARAPAASAPPARTPPARTPIDVDEIVLEEPDDERLAGTKPRPAPARPAAATRAPEDQTLLRVSGPGSTVHRARPASGAMHPASGAMHPAPGAMHPAPGAMHPAPGAMHPASGAMHPAPGAMHPAPGAMHPAPGAMHPAPGAMHPAPGAMHPAPGAMHPAPGAMHPASGAMHPAPGAMHTESRGVLQHNRIPDREGLLASDLAQQPAWLKLLVGVLALALFAALGWAAFKGTAFLRQRAQDTSFEADDEGR